MSKKIELLSPAGSIEAFYAALKNGADAVYLGGKFFNARKSANNFDIQQIREIVTYAHIRNVKVYVTVNILILDEELEAVIDFLKELYLANVDGVIIQDIGLIKLISTLFGGLEMHASTQMTVYNRYGAQFLKNLGFSRVVVARETSQKEIEEIAKNEDIDVEVFGHGALCISYSGQCLLSSMIGGRSGNRGCCAQPCRLIYELIHCQNGERKSIAKGHLLSPKDLCSIKNIDDFIKSGVASLKIEGRLKTPEYVATVTKIYRKYIDNLGMAVNEKDMHDLTQIFNRGGFTDGYFAGYAPNNMITTNKPKNWGTYLGKVISYNINKRLVKVKLKEQVNMGDGIEVWNGAEKSPSVIISQIILNNKMVKSANENDVVELGYLSGRISKNDKVYKTSDKKLNQMARATIDGKELIKRVGLNATIRVKLGEKLYLKIADMDNNAVEKSEDIYPEIAQNRPLDKQRIIEQLQKTGNTPFYFTNIDVELDHNVTVPISKINGIRSFVLQELEDLRGSLGGRKLLPNFEQLKKELLCQPNESKVNAPYGVTIFMYNIDYEMPIWELNVTRIYVPLLFINDNKFIDVLQKCRQNNIELCLWIPSITRNRYDDYIQKNLSKISQFDGILCGNIGTIQQLHGNNIRILGDYSLNVANSYAMKLLNESGVKLVTVSPELTLSQINELQSIDGLQKEVIAYGVLPVMTSQYCVVGDLCGEYKNGTCNGACKNGKYCLKDRKGEIFKIKCDPYSHRMTIFNSNGLLFGENVIKLKGIDNIRLNILDESFEEIKDLVVLHKDMLDGVCDLEKIKKLENKGYTRGHLFRGGMAK